MSNDLYQNLYKEELLGVYRAITQNKDTMMSFSLVPSMSEIPEIDYIKSQNLITFRFPDNKVKKHLHQIRGLSDSLASRIRWHDNKIYQDIINEENLKNNQIAKDYLSVFERVRTDVLISKIYKGCQKNIIILHNDYINLIKKEKRQKNIKIESIEAKQLLSFYLYNKLLYNPVSNEINHMVNNLGINIDELNGNIKKLSNLIDAQHQYGVIIAKIMIKLLEDNDNKKDKNKSNNEEKGFEEESREEIEEFQVPSPSDEAKSEKNELMKKYRTSTIDSLKDAVDNNVEAKTKDDKTKSSNTDYDDKEKRNIDFIYSAYTTKYDEIIKAENMVLPEELIRYRMQLDSKLKSMKDITNRLAIKLQKKLNSYIMYTWDFNMEEGILDAAKLPMIITDPTFQTPYKLERRIEDKNTIITILLDNSGSMRGRPITIAALCTDILARTLERCGIRTEILGFTTKEWKGGESKKEWLKNGSPEFPGRLNDLLHIVYKDANSSWRKSKKNLGLMLKEGLLKENIDGEALLWAYDRILGFPEERKIIMVISDGAPIDDSTLSANKGFYILENHLKKVVKMIEKENLAELIAIGIGHDVHKIYSRAVTINHIDQLGDAIVKQFANLFDEQFLGHCEIK